MPGVPVWAKAWARCGSGCGSEVPTVPRARGGSALGERRHSAVPAGLGAVAQVAVHVVLRLVELATVGLAVLELNGHRVPLSVMEHLDGDADVLAHPAGPRRPARGDRHRWLRRCTAHQGLIPRQQRPPLPLRTPHDSRPIRPHWAPQMRRPKELRLEVQPKPRDGRRTHTGVVTHLNRQRGARACASRQRTAGVEQAGQGARYLIS